MDERSALTNAKNKQSTVEKIACLSFIQLPSEPVWVEVVGSDGWLEVLLFHGRTPWAILDTHLSRVHAAFLRLASIR